MLSSDSFQECSFIINQVAWSRSVCDYFKECPRDLITKNERVRDRCGSTGKVL